MFVFSTMLNISSLSITDQTNTNNPEDVQYKEKNKDNVKLVIPPIGSLYKSEFNVTSTGDYYDGYNLFVLDKANIITHLQEIHLVVIDMEGNLIASRYLGTTQALVFSVAKFINSTTIVVGGIYQPFLWNFYDNTTKDLRFNEHHDIEYISKTNTYLTLAREEVIIEGFSYVFDRIVEYQPNGTAIWTVSTQSFVSYKDWCPYQDMSGEARSITHCNSLFYNPEDDTILLSCRNMNTIYKINHTTKELIWALGEHGDFDLYDIKGNQKDSLWYHAHAFEYFDDDKIILFDNDFHNQTNLASRFTRLVEIQIDEEHKTAHEIWSYVAPDEYYTNIWGDADKLPNGDVLGTFGSMTHSFDSHDAKILEINEQGEIVWKLDFVENDVYTYGLYRCDRFNLQPGLEEIDEVHSNSIENTTLQLETWSGYRTRTNLEGYYRVYLNDSLVLQGSHVFKSYWRKTILDINLGKLSKGYYNLTIALEDDVGHINVKSIDLNVESFYVIRSGFVEIEVGQPETILRWEGKAESPLLLNLTIDGYLYNSTTWFNSNISIDLNNLTIASHRIEFLLYNSSKLVYNDTFYAYVYLAEPPEVTTSLSQVVITWGEVGYITWNLFDNTPDRWEIWVNEELYSVSDWTIKSYELNWKVPNFDEGNYNVTIILFDFAGFNSSSSVNLIIISPSPPVILYIPSEQEYQFGIGNITISWEVHGGNTWKIYVDDTIYAQGVISDILLTFTTDNWDVNIWNPGKHYVTLEIENEEEEKSTSTIAVIVWLNKADPYADSVVYVLSELYDNGENALGAPDDQTCWIFEGYTLGYITLDMGEQEEIINKNGDDLKIYASGGEYQIWVGNDIYSPFTYLGTATGNSSFNIDSISFSQVRYVRVQYTQGDFINLDAIEAIYYNTPEWDSYPPIIQHLLDIEAYRKDRIQVINWVAFDSNPYNYSISVDGMFLEAGDWNGSVITCYVPLIHIGDVFVSLLLFDTYGNSAEGWVRIIVSGASTITLILSITLPGIMAIVGLIQFVRIRRLKMKVEK